MSIKNKKHTGSLTGSFDTAFRASSFYQFFRSHDESEYKYRESFFYGLFHSKKLSAAIRVFKNTFARGCENSTITVWLKKTYGNLLNCSIRSFAIVFLYFSFYSFAISAVKYALGGSADVFINSVYTALIIMFLSIVFLPLKDSFGGFTQKSKIMSFIKTNLFMDNIFDKDAGTKVVTPSNGALIAAGTALGLLTAIMPIGSVIRAGIHIFLVLCFFRTPENSLPLIILLCPFVSQRFLTELVLFSLSAYIFKVLRGKRNFNISFFDVTVLFLCCVIFVGGFTSSSNGNFEHGVLRTLTVMSAYFIFRNCADEIRICRKCVYSLAVSGAAASIVMIYEFLYSRGYISFITKFIPLDIDLTPPVIFYDIISFGEFLLLLLPFSVMSTAVSRSPGRKMFFAVCSALCAAALVCTNSKGVLIAFALCVLIYITASFRNPFASLVTLILFCTSLSLFITNSAFLGNDRFFNINGYKENILIETSHIISDNLIAGIGLGAQNFADIFRIYSGFSEASVNGCYNMYAQLLAQFGIFGFSFFMCVSVIYFKMQFSALSHSRNNNLTRALLAISSICAMSAIYLRGLTSYVWNDHKILFIVFSIVGLSAASYYNSLKSRSSSTEDNLL